MEIDAAGRVVALSSPEKVFFEARGETKLDLVRYFLAVEQPVLRAIGGRPVLMERYPDGASGKSFFQKRVPKGAPAWLETAVVSTPNGTSSDALVVADIAHVVWAVNLGCLGFHAWPSRAADLAHADELRIDLDPQPGVTLAMVREAAAEARALLVEVGLEGFPKTTGRDGIHVYCRLEPRYDPYQVRAAAVAFARELERRRGDLITAQWWKEDRGRRVFCDFNQNAPHKTVFAAWGARPRPTGQVSMPFRWEDLEAVEPDAFSIATVPGLVAERGDPWEAIDARPGSLDLLLAWSERDLADGLMDAPWPPVYPKMPNESPRVSASRARKPPPEEADDG
ncbi:MAG: ATP-dependent DNA ligase [Actinobacteria bacterium]|nr:ATP-dependent DNA ligase [Actinomycetota bacterium]